MAVVVVPLLIFLVQMEIAQTAIRVVSVWLVFPCVLAQFLR
jgi:hypothetical protein